MSPPSVRYPIGISDFRQLREGGFSYVDKTGLIDDVIAEGAAVMLIPRPRRFGKTLALSMLRYFFEKSAADRSALFADLAIASAEAARPHFQRYPVIFLTFKDIKPASWDDCLGRLAEVVGEACAEHRYLLDEGALQPEEAERFTALLQRRANNAQLVSALGFLSRVLARHHRESAIILLDEYDTPIHAGHSGDFYPSVVGFLRDFLSSGFKDNPHLYKGILTGVLRIAKESLFSGLDNIAVYSILRAELSPWFGFTEPEVERLVEAEGGAASLDDLRRFYNGYLFGPVAIYNPWSVLSYLSRRDKDLAPYWIETSDNALVRELLFASPGGVKAELSQLLAGGTIDKPIDENVVLRDLGARSGAVWSLLLFTGYLKPVEQRLVDGQRWARLAVPNVEVALALRSMARDWFEAQVGGSEALEALLAALLRGDAPVVETHLGHLLKANVSFFDTASPEPERFYHGLVVGLLAGLGGGYEVRSNRESGLGRSDVLILPRQAGGPGVVLELKRVGKGETMARAMRAALGQIRERDYAAELRARGASPIHEMAAVFDGKQATVRGAGQVTKATPRGATKKPARRR
jgi:hypothetical protein